MNKYSNIYLQELSEKLATNGVMQTANPAQQPSGGLWNGAKNLGKFYVQANADINPLTAGAIQMAKGQFGNVTNAMSKATGQLGSSILEGAKTVGNFVAHPIQTAQQFGQNFNAAVASANPRASILGAPQPPKPAHMGAVNKTQNMAAAMPARAQ